MRPPLAAIADEPAYASAPEPALDRESDPEARLSNAFFSQAPVEQQHPVWDDAPLPALTRGSRRAMQATVVILVGSILAISGYAAYTHLVLPQPVELGKSSGMPPAPPPVLPTPEPPAMVAHAPPAAAVTVNLAPSMPEPAAAAVPPTALANAAQAPASPQVAAAAPSPTRPSLDPAISAQLASASTLYVAGRTKDALAAYERVLAAQPDLPEALARVAFIQLNTHHNARARELAMRAVELDPTNSEAWIVLGAARGALGDHRGARQAYRSCAEQAVGEYALECRRLAR